ncbi:hypothetical protein [Pseudomonas sp. EA_35y_Pfl2_R111]|uniref:hypothetical protein n=1 Tax=Pseudomonas sp. EA_35y_Pfl2_R111 TaxID=3088689 RepID=UPI0030DDB0BF
MFIERREHNGRLELWECEWERPEGEPSRKVFLRRLGLEQPLRPEVDQGHAQAEAICWAYGRTLGNIAVFTQEVLGSFAAEQGNDAILACDLVDAGKFRHGPDRWWCRTHQKHWGTKADILSARRAGRAICSNHDQPMSYVLNPFHIRLDEHVEVGMWCSLPPAITSGEIIRPRPPKIHLHVREEVNAAKVIDGDYEAISLHYNPESDLFGNSEISKVNITPPSALEFMLAIEHGRDLDCINCSTCGYPHLDLGEFGLKPHRKHFCGNCGRDSTWSKQPIVSTPLKPLHDQFDSSAAYEVPERILNLDEFEGCNFAVWASTPAILWTANRSQEKGVHVHVRANGKWLVDDTFGSVIYKGELLVREQLLDMMLNNTIV